MNQSIASAASFQVTGNGIMASNPQEHDFYSVANLSVGHAPHMFNAQILDGRNRVSFSYAPFFNQTHWEMKCLTEVLADDTEVAKMWTSLMGPLGAAVYADSFSNKDLFVAVSPIGYGYVSKFSPEMRKTNAAEPAAASC